MKKIIFLCLLVLFINITFGQNELYGTWKASCPLEKASDGSANICDLCPTDVVDENIVMQSLELTIDERLIHFTVDHKTVTTANYTWDSDRSLITFWHVDRTYKFRVLLGTAPNQVILKEDELGSLLLLAKE